MACRCSRAGWAQAGAEALIERADFIAPAPMHWTRLAVRSFNQAAWLAQALSRASGKPWKPGALRRVKRRKSQAGLSASERRRNVGGRDQGVGAVRGQNHRWWLTMFSPRARLWRPAPVHCVKRGLQKCMA